jgi:protein TonB
MFGTLLESRARRHRRTGGAALSIAAHITLIGVATAATVHGRTSSPTPPKPEFIVFTATPPAPRHIEHRKPTAHPTSSRTTDFRPIVLTIPQPRTTPPTLPPIDISSPVTPDDIVVGSGTPGNQRGPVSRTLDLTDDWPTGGELHGRELLMRIVSSAKPRYPEALRQNGIDGRVVVQFVVDTTGSVDPNSVRVLQSTHDLFTQAVRSALASFRFRPAEVGGRRTPALAEMPFEFRVTR